MIELFGTALVPDFAEHYHLRLAQVVEEYHPKEVLLLIYGLPTSSRFHGRLMGEKRPAWSDLMWLLLDTRNELEAIRVNYINANRNKGGKKAEFLEWEQTPGQVVRKRRKADQNLDRLRRSAQKAGGRVDVAP